MKKMKEAIGDEGLEEEEGKRQKEKVKRQKKVGFRIWGLEEEEGKRQKGKVKRS
jgi:hypothetical protein